MGYSLYYKHYKTCTTKNGREVKIGQRVSIEGTVTFTNAGEEFCNVNILLTEEGQPHGPFNVTNQITANARQLTIVKAAPKFAEGTVVRKVDSDTPMTVTNTSVDCVVSCEWFEGNTHRGATFAEDELVPVVTEGEPEVL